MAWTSTLDHIRAVNNGALGPCHKRLTFCACDLNRPCLPCGGASNCDGITLDLQSHIPTIEACKYRDLNEDSDTAGELICDPLSVRPFLLVANINGVICEFVQGQDWWFQDGCIRLGCNIERITAGICTNNPPNYEWNTETQAWQLVDAGDCGTLALYGTFGKCVPPELWDCVLDLFCLKAAGKRKPCGRSEDTAISMSQSGSDGSTTYTFADRETETVDDWWRVTDGTLNEVFYRHAVCSGAICDRPIFDMFHPVTAGDYRIKADCID